MPFCLFFWTSPIARKLAWGKLMKGERHVEWTWVAQVTPAETTLDQLAANPAKIRKAT